MNEDAVRTVIAHVARDAGGKCKAYDDTQIREHFESIEQALVSVINSTFLKNAPKDQDRWDMIYHGITIGHGFIRSHNAKIGVIDKNLQREYYVSPIMAWIIEVFRSIIVPTERLPSLTNVRAMMIDLCHANTPWNEVSFAHSDTSISLSLLIHQHKLIKQREENLKINSNLHKVSKKKLLGRKRDGEDAVMTSAIKRIKLSSLSLDETVEDTDRNDCVHDENASDEMESSALIKTDMGEWSRALSKIPDWRQSDYSPEIMTFLQRNDKIFKILNIITENANEIVANTDGINHGREILNCVTRVYKIMMQQQQTVKVHANAYDYFVKELNQMNGLCGSLSTKITKLKCAQDLHDRNQDNFNRAMTEVEKWRTITDDSARKVNSARAFLDILCKPPEA